MKILVAFGGVSPEHEVSVLTAMQAIAALREKNHSILPLYISKSGKWFTGSSLLELETYKELSAIESQTISCSFSHNEVGKAVLSTPKKGGWFSKAEVFDFDVVLCAFHGSDGENGSFQGICETYNIPYTGSGVLASSVGMDKVKAKAIVKAAGISVVEGVDFYEENWVSNKNELIAQIEKLSYPLIVKPVNLGSSIGVSKAKDQKELILKIEEAFRFDHHLLVEKVIDPLREINCSVLGGFGNSIPSVCEMPVTASEFLSFEDKYQRENASAKGMASADRIIPAPIEDGLRDEIQKTAVNAFNAIGCAGVSRIDFLLDEKDQLYFNEINTIPGSFSFYLWDKTDYPFPKLLEKLIEIAFDGHRLKNGRARSYETNLLSSKAAKGIKGLKGAKGK